MMRKKVRAKAKKAEKKKDSPVFQPRRPNSSQSLNSPRNHTYFPQRALVNQTTRGSFTSGIIQPKLTIGQPNDKYEQEADRVAEHVVRMPDPRIQHQIEPKEEDPIQTKGNSSSPAVVSPGIVSSIKSLKGGGQPLPESTRKYFEPRFNHDFSQVRVHTGPKAVESARRLNARAYTLGSNIVFGAGQYTTQTSSGQRLLFHELTHVVQQSGIHDKIGTYNNYFYLADGVDHLFHQSNLSRVKGGLKNKEQNKNFISERKLSPLFLQTKQEKNEKKEWPEPTNFDTFEDWIRECKIDISRNPPERKSMDFSPPGLRDLLRQLKHKTDCIDMAIVLRHYFYMKKNIEKKMEGIPSLRPSSWKTGLEFRGDTIGEGVTTEKLAEILKAYHTSAFYLAPVQFDPAYYPIKYYYDNGEPEKNLLNLVTKGLKSGDVFVWRPEDWTGPGHVQTIQDVFIDKDSTTGEIISGKVTVIQGHMRGRSRKIYTDYYSFKELTGKENGNGLIEKKPGFHRDEPGFREGYKEGVKRYQSDMIFVGSGEWK